MHGLTDSRLVTEGLDLCIRDVVLPSDAQYASKAPLIEGIKTRQIALVEAQHSDAYRTIGKMQVLLTV